MTGTSPYHPKLEPPRVEAERIKARTLCKQEIRSKDRSRNCSGSSESASHRSKDLRRHFDPVGTLASFTLFVLLFAPPTRCQTKPSDVFFCPPDCSPFDINTMYAPSIVFRGVKLRGWLMRWIKDYPPPTPFSGAVFMNESVNGGVHIGYEDVHYELLLDYDFITATYGSNSLAFAGAMLHGNPIDGQTVPIPIQDISLSGSRPTVDINSFVLPYSQDQDQTHIHMELNSWHARGSHHCDLGIFCWHKNYTGRGQAPSGWVEKEYTSPLPGTAADNWWPFDPDNPDGQRNSDGSPVYLKVGDYVEVSGTLWEDSGAGHGESSACWGIQFHNHGAWPEIHPVDSMTRLPSPGPSPVNDVLGAARAGLKRVIESSICTDATGSFGNDPHSGINVTACPESTFPGSNPPARSPTGLQAHYLELIDGRFSALPSAGLVRNVNILGDCVGIDNHVESGHPSTHFKATYVVWWTSPSPQAPTFSLPSGSYDCPQSVSLSDSDPAASLFYTTDGTIPSQSSTRYVAPFNVTSTETVNAIAFNAAGNPQPSPVSSSTYACSEPVRCFVFDDGYTNMAGPSDAVYINSNMMHACIPDNTPTGQCRKWFGRCFTAQTKAPVLFDVFDDGYNNLQGPSDAVYINAPSSGIQACIPSGPTGFCRKWFGRGISKDGRSVNCSVFDDGNANQTAAYDAIYVFEVTKDTMDLCVPSNSPNGICRKWFGRCVAK